jgi:CBS domain-containing protein
MGTNSRKRFLVADALTPVQYRVYPDTPLLEVLDLIVRRRLRVVPIVGDRYEVLGLITAGDALRHLPSRQHLTGNEAEPGDQDGPVCARDVMTRSVLCVSEEQALTEAANMMVNRDVDQLPVVRAGELVGFLTRKSVLRILFTSQKDS